MSEAEPGKRSLIATLAAFALLTIVVVSVSWIAGATRTEERPAPPPAPPPPAEAEEPDPDTLAYLGPLATGEAFDGWRVARVEPIREGHLRLELAGGGETIVVDVWRREPEGPQGVARTEGVAIYVRSERGSQTSAAAVRASEALAAALRAREEAGHLPPPLDALR